MGFKQGSDNGLIYIYRLSRLLASVRSTEQTGQDWGQGTPVWSSRAERCWLNPGWGLGETRESMGWGETLEPKAWDLVTD